MKVVACGRAENADACCGLQRWVLPHGGYGFTRAPMAQEVGQAKGPAVESSEWVGR